MSSSLELDLSLFPYLDDFDETKDFVKVLFVPGRAVQTRELNTMQTILQTQITRFGDHIFKEGSVVSGISVTYIPSMPFVNVKNAFISNADMSVLDVTSNNLIVSATTGVRAVPRVSARGFETQYPDTNRFYVDYIVTGLDGSNNDVKTFANNETLTIYSGAQNKFGTLDSNNIVNTISTIASNNATGNAYAVSISDGIVYQKGYFLRVAPQICLVKQFDTNTANYAVGFETGESLITEDDDESLLSNAQGTPNFNAPGAHRLKLVPELVSVDKTALAANSSFLPIVEFADGVAVEQHTDSTYDLLGDALAKRTYEESGDYVSKPFAVETLVSPNTAQMYYAVSPGVGYVKGYRTELIGTKKVSVDRAIDTDESLNQIITANYGNYVIVNEAVGLFDFDQQPTVSIYDTLQTSITDVEGAGTAPTGNSVGTAEIRGFEYLSGTKGLANAQFQVYLTNIQMVSGKTFLTDAKSFYLNGTNGKAKADIVLESSQAKLKDSGLDTLVFPTGIDNIRRLTNKIGVNDTQFVFRDIVSATMQTNGFVTFTINTPYAGGTERINASVGTLAEANETEYTVSLSAAAYSANQTGTISTSASNTATGTSTLFSSVFQVGDYIRFTDGNVRRITNIASNTTMSLNSTVSETGANFGKYWPQGHLVNLSGSNGSINIISNTQFSVSSNLSITGSGTQTVWSQYPVLRTTAVPIKKEVQKGRLVKIDCTSNTTGPWGLGLTDAFVINHVYVGTTYSASNPDRSDWFDFNTGQTLSKYDHSSLVLKPQYASKINANTRIVVDFDRFSANTSAGIGFFSVGSYPFIDEGDTANSTNVAIASVPLFNGHDVRELIDFRLRKVGTANSTTVIADATVNPSGSNSSYNNITNGTYVIQPATNFEADMEVYLPRKDILSISKDGEIIITKGVPNVFPRTPSAETDVMPIATIDVPAYPTLTTREAELYGRGDISTVIHITTNRDYNMRDIGVLDDRLKLVEYYVELNMLEQAARDLTIPDTNGLDRFKNGIYANPFNSQLLGSIDDIEYKIAIDQANSVARPFFKTYPIDYKYSSSNSANVQVTGTHVTLPYTTEAFITQPYASKYRNCSESIWNWKGTVSLYPSYDYFKDVINQPSVNLNGGVENPQAAQNGTEYGDWRVVGSSSSTSSNSSASTTTTSTTETRSATSFTTLSSNNKQSFGSVVTDVSQNPYMRARQVAFVATSLKPSSKIYAYFDDEPVSAYCAPGTLSGNTTIQQGHEDSAVNRSAAYGTQLVSNSTGGIAGIFSIPAAQFRTGDRTFMLTDVDDLSAGGDAKETAASATYTASSLSIDKTELTLTTQRLTVASSTRTDSQVLTSTSTSILPPPTSPPSPTPSPTATYTSGPGSQGWDPIAQSFDIVTPRGITGSFINKIDVYFKAKDQTLGITCMIVQMFNGTPDTSKVVASKYLPASSVSISNDASWSTPFIFDNLPYLTSGESYAFLLKPDGDSPEYKVWLSEIGNVDTLTEKQIFSNPYTGVAFISANMNTWTPIQTEDIKFTIYRCKFTVGSGTVGFVNEDDEFLTIDGITKANSSIDVQVGDYAYNSNSSAVFTSNTDPVGRVHDIDIANDRIVLDMSTGGFGAANTIQFHRPYLTGSNTINANTKIGSATITSLDNIEYAASVPRFAYIAPSYTTITFNHRGVNTSLVPDTFYTVTPETENEMFDHGRLIASKSNEGGVKSSIYHIDLQSDSDFVSPVIDLSRKGTLFIENIINNDDTNESTQYGSALTKFISPTIILADGQDAEDLQVRITAYRPVGTDVEVYAKILNAEDGGTFNSKVWSKLNLSAGNTVFSTTSDRTNRIEYVYGFANSAPVTSAAFLSSGLVQYTDSAGAVYKGYKRFALKVVLLSTTKYIVPLLDDIRSIALQT